ncbi:LysR family transcriptional regulator [Herbaspirillum rubrisubalbicans]|uniref:LysR family transcriptional regulator n=3 Tax=Herbaspirillum TaxID=963 RepID=A0ABX9BWK3_9BURK|nr:LysR substrate-binding domain-containing protein [Herbaspirillum rubrisubalbicans]NQE48929.1 LysR family transcriptional regulator [Herbaspirillum rubrisubalbicans]QJQ03858.1 LysR family transcriptional regulator [Herbaspirillum rubrisubalbicans Os34]RAM62223.1 LysR family transcriptional regulator [Herbaspirillum rubrisubalbicans]RAN50056.1 LysR family transcriptional regulator [Herbaspirillum rubrisubalbicans]
MELRHLRYFQALAENLSFTRAAEKVHVTQSTLSHQIRQLEEELAVVLFDRVGKKVVLTDAGETLLTNIAPALKQVDLAIRTVKAEDEHMVGEVRIGSTHSFNIHVIPHCIAGFLNRYPSIKVIAEELSAQEITSRLMEGKLDLGVSYRPEVTEQLWFEPLYNEEMLLVVRNDHPLAKRRQIRLIQLHGVDLVLLPSYFSTRKMLDECFHSVGTQPHVVAELNTIAPMFELVRQANIGAIVGASACPVSGDLTYIPLENPTPLRNPGLLWKRGAPRDAAVKYFANIIRRVVAKSEMRLSSAKESAPD